jgi:hypothetical protein
MMFLAQRVTNVRRLLNFHTWRYETRLAAQTKQTFRHQVVPLVGKAAIGVRRIRLGDSAQKTLALCRWRLS